MPVHILLNILLMSYDCFHRDFWHIQTDRDINHGKIVHHKTFAIEDYR